MNPDQFEEDKREKSYFKGDSNSYLPLSFNLKPIFWGKLPVTLLKSDWSAGIDFFFSQNELTIDDNILTYSTRSTKFMNY